MENAPAGVLQLLQSVDSALKSIRQEMEKLNERVYDLELKFQGDPYNHHGPADDVASLRSSITDLEYKIGNLDSDLYDLKGDVRDLERRVE